MFSVDSATKKITLHRGDTGEVTFTASGYSYGSDDRALFTVKDSGGTEIFKRVYELEDNSFVVEFTNSMTDYLTPGMYSYDVRYIIDPVWSGEGADAEIVDGEQVTTPGSPYTLEILGTVGQI